MPPTPSPSPIYIQMLGEASTFWDSPASVALIALIGVALGAVLGFWFNWLLEARKQARVEAIRWDDDLRNYGAEVFLALKEMGRAAQEQDAFRAGMDAAIKRSVEKIPDDEIEEGMTRETRAYLDLLDGLANSEQWSALWQRTETAWEQLVSLNASITMIAPPRVSGALDPVTNIAAKMNNIRREADGGWKLGLEADEAARNLLLEIRRHLGLAVPSSPK